MCVFSNVRNLYKDNTFDENAYLENLQKRFPPKVSKNTVDYTPDYFVEDVDNNSEEELEPEPEPKPKPKPKPELDPKLQKKLDKIKKTNNFLQYETGYIKSNEAVELYKALGGTDEKFINASGVGKVMKIRSGISDLLKNTYHYNEKSKTKK